MRQGIRARSRRAAALFLWIGEIVLAGAAVGWLVLLRPPALGGTTSYVLVSGGSMRPTLEIGDLVVAQPASEYGPGDVVVYKIPQDEPGAGRLVVHRIVAGDAMEGFTTQGDYNDYTDAWHPRGADIVGVPIAILPQAGVVLWFLRQPLMAATLAAGVTVLVLWPREARGRLNYVTV